MGAISKVTKLEQVLLNNERGKCIYYPSFISQDYTGQLIKQVHWEQNNITIFGKTCPIPRLNAWYSDQKINYTYSGHTLKHNNWFALLLRLKNQVEDFCDYEFNSCLVNYYRCGHDYVSWHKDNEYELGPDPFIATLSFGQSRKFQLRQDKKTIINKDIESGSLLITCDGLHHNYHHQIAKSAHHLGPRVSLTFRYTYPN